MVKQKNNMKKNVIIIGFVILLIGLPVLVNASMYDILQDLEGKDCTLLMRKLGASGIPDLRSEFGLTGTDYCYFVTDHLSFYSGTEDLIWYDDVWYADPWYAEIDYVVDDDGYEYLFLLGKDSSALGDLINFTANYDKFQDLLSDYDEMFYMDENFWDWYDPNYVAPDNDCVDNPAESVYFGNSATYLDPFTLQSTTIDSYCLDANTIFYPFCEGEMFLVDPYDCDCANGKCIASNEDVFYWIEFYGFSIGPGNRLVDEELIGSAIRSWINN